MKILGINISHEPSVCMVENGNLVRFFDETRFIRKKTYVPSIDASNVIHFKSIEQKFSFDEVDHIIFTSWGNFLYEKQSILNHKNMNLVDKLQIINEDFTTINKFNDHLKRKFPRVEKYNYQNEHHLYHALCGYNFSGFSDAVCIVMDGGGVPILDDYPTYQEIESIYYINKTSCDALYKHLSNIRYKDLQYCIPKAKNKSFLKIRKNNCDYHLSSKMSSGYKFTILTHTLGIDKSDRSGMSAGKTMGMAAYGKLNGNEPPDMAKRLQNITAKNTYKLIEHAVKISGCKNIVLSGGYAMNCLNNFKYVKRFPELNIFVDPCAHDGGTAIGAAIWLNRKLNDNLR